MPALILSRRPRWQAAARRAHSVCREEASMI